MIYRTNDYSICAKQDKGVADSDRSSSNTNSTSPTGKPTAVWESPDFEEFDLCMEVTAIKLLVG